MTFTDIEEVDPMNTKNATEIICPTCGYEQQDSWRYISKDFLKCQDCGEPMKLEVFPDPDGTGLLYTTKKVE